MRLIKTFLLAASLSLGYTAYAADNQEIDGVKIGSKPDELKASIASLNASLATAELKDSNDKIIGLQAKNEAGTGWELHTPDHVVGLFDNEGYTWFVGRAQKYIKGDRPSLEVTLKTLMDKYGPPSYVTSSRLEWQFDRSNNLYTGANDRGPCWTGFREMRPFEITVTSPKIEAPKHFSPKCSMHIVAKIQKESDGMVGSLSVSMYNAASVYDRMQRERAVIEAEKQKKLEAEKAKAVKPKL